MRDFSMRTPGLPLLYFVGDEIRRLRPLVLRYPPLPDVILLPILDISLLPPPHPLPRF